MLEPALNLRERIHIEMIWEGKIVPSSQTEKVIVSLISHGINEPIDRRQEKNADI